MDIVDVLQGMKSGDIRTSLNVYGRAIDEITKLREQLALRDLENMKLREALCKATRSLYGMQVPKYYSDLIDETFTPTHLQEWYQGMVEEDLAKIKELPRFSFLSPTEGGVRRFADKSGAWVEYYEVIKIMDKC